MTTVVQYARDDIYEMGGAAGWHMHTDGAINIDGQDIRVGGHILGFVGLKNAAAEAMNIASTKVQENGIWRDAWGRENLGMEIAKESVGEGAHPSKIKAISHTITSQDYQKNPKDLWSSFVRDEEKRNTRTKELITRTRGLVAKKDEILGSAEFIQKLSVRKTQLEPECNAIR